MEDKMRCILLVEDDPVTSLLEQRQLESGGYHVVRAETGEQAVPLATKDGTIDLILMDIDLGSGMKGTDAARQILRKREVPILFLTNHSEREMVETVKGITRYGYVLKGSGQFVLMDQIATAFELFETKRKLQETQRRYKFIADHTSDAVLVMEHGRYTYASPSVEQMLGYPAEDYKDETYESMFDWVHPADRSRVRGEMEEAARTHQDRVRLTFRALRSDYSYGLIEADVSYTYDQYGNLTVMVASFRDITQRDSRERELQKNLLGAESRLETIAESAPGLLFELQRDPGGRWSVPYLSGAALNCIGITPHEIEQNALRLLDAIHPADRARFIWTITRSARTLSTFEATHRFVDRDGGVRWMSTRATPRQTHNDETAWSGISVDITERVQANVELERREAELRTIFAAARIGIVETDGSGVILRANPTFAASIGYGPDELVGKDIGHFSNPEDQRWETKRITSANADGEAGVSEYRKRFKHRDGSEVWLRINAARVPHDHETRFIHTTAPVQDYRRAGAVETETPDDREPEHYLKAELYRLVQEDPHIFEFLQAGSLDGIWYWDIEHPENEWMSPRFWEVLGYDPTTRRHDPAEWQGLMNPEDLQISLENLAAHVEDPSHPYDQIVRYRHRDGSTVWLRCRGVAVRDRNGTAVRMLGAHNEITRLKETELKLRAALEEKSNLMRELHHRVKNNLAMVHGFLMVKASEVGDTVDLSDTIAQVNAILTAHRLLNVDSEQDDVDLASYIYDLVGTLFQGGTKQGITWTVDLPLVRVKSVAAVNIGLVVNELGINAMKHAYTNGGSFSITGTLTTTHLEIRVENSGAPLPPDFSLEDPSSIGVSLIRGLVRQIKGEIEFSRNPTVFRISAPLELLAHQKTQGA